MDFRTLLVLLLGAVFFTFTCARPLHSNPLASTASSRGLTNDIADLDHLLARVQPGDQSLFVGDMGFNVAALRHYRETLAERQAGILRPNSAFDPAFNKWPKGNVPYAFSGMSSDEQALVIQSCHDWEKAADVHFYPRTNEANYVIFTDSTDGNNSYVGMIGGGQVINIQSYYEFYIAHEIGHALGRIHEQSRSDRDTYVVINYQNIQSGYAFAFDIVPGSLNQGAYDFDSVMHYYLTAFSVNGQATITINPPYDADWNYYNVGMEMHLSVADKAGMAAIYGAPVDKANLTTHILWTSSSGIAAFWNYSPDTGAFNVHNFGPYPAWSARAIAGGGTDAKTRLLWNNTNGAAALWDVTPATGAFTTTTFGPYSGWTANAVSVGSDNTTHILWTNTNGTAALWNIVNGNYQNEHDFGPYPGWTAKALADGPDGKTRLLWTNTSGAAAFWNVTAATGVFSQFSFGPYPGWMAKSLSVSSTTTHVLWGKSDGTAAVWNYTPGTGGFVQQLYGPYSGWSANAMADGSDGKTRLLWDNVNGAASFWSVDTGTGVFSQFSFGPYSGWAAKAVSVGA